MALTLCRAVAYSRNIALLRHNIFLLFTNTTQPLTGDMDVTIENFNDVFHIFSDELKKAQFITIDTEFTGLRVDGGISFNYFDTPKEFYNINRQTAASFLAVQYGICFFEYHPDNDKYTHSAYNFYIYPGESRRNFTCQVSCMSFLAKHGFDFNKLFSKGIPYLTKDEEESKHERLKERKEKMVVDSPIIKVPKEQKKVLDGVMKKIKEFLGGQGSPVLPRYNSFVKRLIHQTAKDEFGEQIMLESNKDGTMKMTKGLSEVEKQTRIEQKWDREKKEIEEEVGFSKIIRMLIESGKPIVGHNVFIDLLFTMHQFLKPLPEDFDEFREIARDLFPRLIDTKHIATAANFRDFAESALDSVMEGFDKSEIPVVEPKSDDRGYKTGDSKPHEAAYDSYITGLAFLAMAGRIGKLNTTNIYKTLPTSPLLTPYLNRLSVPRMHGIDCIDLNNYHPPSRHDVFHISFPEEWKRDDVLAHFQDYGFINLRWIDNKSAFIGVETDAINNLKKRMANNRENLCKVQTYEDFRGPLMKSIEDVKKRRSSEDLGEVVERKKNCTFAIPAFE